MPFSPAMRQSAHVCSKLVLGNGVPTNNTAFTEKLMNEVIKNPGVYIKISDKIATFAYKEFFEGYATRRRIMQ